MTKIGETEIPNDAGHQPAEVRGHDRVPSNIKRILVPTDLTKESDGAIEFGLVLAKRFGAQLTLLHAYREPYAVRYVRGPRAYDAVLEERTYFENTLKSIGEDVRQRYAHCDVEFRQGMPCEEIVHTAKERDVDLIVISTHHHNWLTRIAYGCDAEQILRHAPCPILILQVQRGFAAEGARQEKARRSGDQYKKTDRLR
jgi:nucleotide-binding universal stress UspA family protein